MTSHDIKPLCIGDILWVHVWIYRRVAPTMRSKRPYLWFDHCRNYLTERKECSVNYSMTVLSALEYKLNLARIFIASRDLLH